MTTHTPGPWKAFADNICDSSGRVVAKITGVQGAETDEEYVEAEANAHLIAAAPQMLEALEHWCTACKKTASDSLIAEVCDECTIGAAIRAAKGGTK